jgi:hypothetical protein
MNATAIPTPKIDRAFAVQCLTHILERTTKLLVTAASGGKWGQISMIDVRALPEISRQFVEACGLQAHSPEPQAPWVRQVMRQRRVLGELHAAVSHLLVACAQESVAPQTGDALGATHEIHRVYDIAVAFAAACGE